MGNLLFRKYIWLIDTVYRNRKITYKQIAECWERSDLSGGNPMVLSTFHNQRQAIAELFDIEIVCDECTHEYYIENSGDLRTDSIKNWLLETFSIGNLLQESQGIRNRVLAEYVPSSHKHLSALLEALQGNRIVEVEYHSFQREDRGCLQLFPYFLKLYDRRWYLFGSTEENPQIKVYALDRIHSLTVTDERFTMPEEFSVEDHLADCIGIVKMPDIPPREITIKAYGTHARYLDTLPFHHSQQTIEVNLDYTLFKYHLAPTPDFFQEILWQKDYIEIVSPPEVRKKMESLLRKIQSYYH